MHHIVCDEEPNSMHQRRRSSSSSSGSRKEAKKSPRVNGDSPTSVTMTLSTVTATAKSRARLGATIIMRDDDMEGLSCDGDSVLKTTLVRFAPLVHIYDISTIPKRDVESIWYTDAEYEAIEDECEIILGMIRKGRRLNARKHSFLGLESWTKDGNERRLRHSMDSLKVVFDEQSAQWEDGMEDQEGLAELYMARAKHARMVALTRGLKMERQAQEILAQMLVKSPIFYSSLVAGGRGRVCGLKQEQSLYMERILLLTRSKSFNASASSSATISAATTPLRRPTSNKHRSLHTSPTRKQKVKQTPELGSRRLTSPIRKPKIRPTLEAIAVHHQDSPCKSGTTKRAPKLKKNQSQSSSASSSSPPSKSPKLKISRRVEHQ